MKSDAFLSHMLRQRCNTTEQVIQGLEDEGDDYSIVNLIKN